MIEHADDLGNPDKLAQLVADIETLRSFVDEIADRRQTQLLGMPEDVRYSGEGHAKEGDLDVMLSLSDFLGQIVELMELDVDFKNGETE